MIIIFRIMQITTLYFTLCYQRCYWIYSSNVQSVTKCNKRLNRKSNNKYYQKSSRKETNAMKIFSLKNITNSIYVCTAFYYISRTFVRNSNFHRTETNLDESIISIT